MFFLYLQFGYEEVVYANESETINKCFYLVPNSTRGTFKVDCSLAETVSKSFDYDVIMVAIIFQESGFNPKAVNKNKNKTLDFGIFQLNNRYWEHKDDDIVNDILQAKKCKKQNGYGCWVAYSSGDYKKYLDEAETLLSYIK